ncbi:hypothetical protein JNW90_29290 [Micromonospora sp. STR1s_5]|nr:hypothetical protein [Micromonospora sp. STR1s_5]MBM0206649.1 hypothetical protein [Micromonospora sp. STR1s_5]
MSEAAATTTRPRIGDTFAPGDLVLVKGNGVTRKLDNKVRVLAATYRAASVRVTGRRVRKDDTLGDPVSYTLTAGESWEVLEGPDHAVGGTDAVTGQNWLVARYGSVVKVFDHNSLAMVGEPRVKDFEDEDRARAAYARAVYPLMNTMEELPDAEAYGTEARGDCRNYRVTRYGHRVLVRIEGTDPQWHYVEEGFELDARRVFLGVLAELEGYGAEVSAAL